MKKTTTAVLCLVLLFFVGCNGGQNHPELPQSFVCEVTVEQKDSQALTGEFSRSLTGQTFFEVTAPEWLSGFSFSCKNEEVTLSFGELSVGGEGLLPDTAWFMKLSAVLEDLSGNGTVTLDYYDHQVLVYSGNGKGGNYRLTCDKKTKNPVNLIIGDGITVTFYDMRSN